MSDGSATHEENGHGGHYIVPVSAYAKVISALFVLMTITVVVAFIDLGAWNPVLALVIAISKAVLIVLVFMNVYVSSRLTKMFAASAFFWLLFLFCMIIVDFLSREMVTQPLAWEMGPR